MRKFILSLVCLYLPLAAIAQQQWREGEHYEVIANGPRTGAPANKIEVIEVFSYACIHCNSAVPEVKQLATKLPADATLRYVHAAFNPSGGWPMFQQAFLTAQKMGIADKVHERFFDAIWKTGDFPYVDLAAGRLRQPLPTIQDAARFYANAGGVKADQFLRIAQSKEIAATQARNDEWIKQWRIPGTPAFVVNGRYLINNEKVGGLDNMVSLVNFLIQQERVRLKRK